MTAACRYMLRRAAPPVWRGVAAVVALGAALAGAAPASGQVLRETLPEIENVGIVDRRGNPVPEGLVFKDSLGREVRFGSFFDGKRPVMLVMAYYRCPILCTLVLNRVQRVMNELKWTAGEEFTVVTVSFDHRDTTQECRAKQQQYLLGYNRAVPDSAWEFLTGDVDNIRALAGAVGYHYKFLPENGEFSHPAAIIFLAPDGKVHNYIERLDFTAAEVRLALSEAAEGRIGTLFERALLYCFHYNPKTGQYTMNAMNVMRFGATGGGVLLAGFIGYLVWTRRSAWRGGATGGQSTGKPSGSGQEMTGQAV